MNRTSIIILTHNLWTLTHLCLDSIRRNTEEPYELIVVDNGSTDETVSYLLGQPDIKLIRNEHNFGFARGCNQGFAAASGDTILFLNNDTIVTPGWLSRMLKTLYSDDRIGMVGPLSNHVSGPQQIDVVYKSLSDMDAFSEEHRIQFADVSVDVRRIVGFCMLMKREVLEEAGCFDEQYGLGNYEDDDLCLRVIHSGYRIRIAYDAFIHHFGHMTMATLSETSLSELLVHNRGLAREKWGCEIHSLLFREAVTLSIVVPIGPHMRITYFQDMITKLGSLANEWILIDYLPSEKRSLNDVAAGNISILEAENAGEEELWSRICSTATQQYLLWMSPDEILTAETVRRIEGLKVQLDGTEDGVSFLVELELDNTHSSTVQRIRLVRRETQFGWNPVTREFIMRPSSLIKKGNIIWMTRRPPN